MSSPISIVIPSLADRELLGTCLQALQAELDLRGGIDEVLVVDDSGAGELAPWLEENHPGIRCLCNERNLGFAVSLLAGVRAASKPFVFAMNPDLRLRPGFFGPMLETSSRDGVRAVSPLVLNARGEFSEESLPRLTYHEGFARLECQELDVRPGEPSKLHPDGVPVDFALGGAFLVGRDEFLARPFDPRFEPFYWEDVDWCQDAIAKGGRVLVDPRAVAEHHNRGTIGAHVPQSLVRAAIEKNRLLFTWKHTTEPAAREAHFKALTQRLLEHGLAEDREELLWLLLALQSDRATPIIDS